MKTQSQGILFTVARAREATALTKKAVLHHAYMTKKHDARRWRRRLRQLEQYFKRCNDPWDAAICRRMSAKRIARKFRKAAQ